MYFAHNVLTHINRSDRKPSYLLRYLATSDAALFGFAAMLRQLYNEFKSVRDNARVFGRQVLLEEICRTAKQGDLELFAKFQLDTINRHFGGLSECLAVNVLHMKGDKPDVQSLVSVVAGCDTAVSDSYRSTVIADTFTPLTFQRCGAAVFVHAVHPMEVWEKADIFRRHCRPCGLHWIVGLSYAVPHDKLTFLVFDYMNPKDRPFPPALHEAEIEYASYPFYLGWLHLHRRMCAQTLEEHLTAYGSVGMTPLRFAVIRGMVGHRQFRTDGLANVLGASQKAIKKHIETAFDNIAEAEICNIHFEEFPDDVGEDEQGFHVHKYGGVAGLVDRFGLMRNAPGELRRTYVARIESP